MPDNSRVYFGRMAETYDRRRADTENWLAEKAVIVPQFEAILPGERVLDIAAGTGRWLEFLKDHGVSVTLLDVSAEMLSFARQKADALGLPVDVIVDNALLMERYPAADWMLSTRFFNWITLADLRTVLAKAKAAGIAKFMFTIGLMPDDAPLVSRFRARARIARSNLRTSLGLRRTMKAIYSLHRESDFRQMIRASGLVVTKEITILETYGSRKIFFVLTLR